MASSPSRFYRRRRKKREPAPCVEAVASALNALGLTDQARRLQIGQAWRHAVGEEIAARTEPHTFSRGVLTVKAATAAWQNELTFLKRDIIQNLNRELGRMAVRDLRVIGGRVGVRKSENEASQGAPSQVDIDAAMPHAQPIDDPEIREAFARFVAAQTRYLRER